MESLTDGELERLAASGNRDAFGQLYERHCDRVYDFLLRMTQNSDEAADLMQETFVRAMKSLSSEKAGGAAFSTWLFTIARNLALTRLERRERTVPLIVDEEGHEAEGVPAHLIVDEDRFADPAEAIGAKETAGLVWQAAAALNPKEYSLLDLHVRQGLDSAEIASVLGVSKGNAYTMLSRLKNTFEEAVASLVMFKRGRSYCAELDRILSDNRIHEMSVSARKLISRHAAQCETCREQRRRLVSAEAVLRALVPLPFPLLLKYKMAEAAFGQGTTMGAEAAKNSVIKSLWRHSAGRSARASLRVKGIAASLTAIVLGVSIVSWVLAQGSGGSRDGLVVGPTATFAHEAAGLAITPTPTETLTPTPTPHSATPTQAPVIPPPTSPPLTPWVPAPSAPPAPTPAASSCVGVPPFPVAQLPAGYVSTEIRTGPPGETAGFNGQLEQSEMELENYYRSTLGLGPLTADSRLDQAAKSTAKQLVEAGWIGKNFLPGHISPDGQGLSQRLADVGLVQDQNVYWASENYYWGINAASAAWLFANLSEYHRRDIAADCLYGAPKGPYYGIGCYFTYPSQLQFVCIVDYAAFK
jgi:RNA polymerase sigma factor (sigma-70 family)